MSGAIRQLGWFTAKQLVSYHAVYAVERVIVFGQPEYQDRPSDRTPSLPAVPAPNETSRFVQPPRYSYRVWETPTLLPRCVADEWHAH